MHSISHQNYRDQIKFFVHTSKICDETKEDLLPLAAGRSVPSLLSWAFIPCIPAGQELGQGRRQMDRAGCRRGGTIVQIVECLSHRIC